MMTESGEIPKSPPALLDGWLGQQEPPCYSIKYSARNAISVNTVTLLKDKSTFFFSRKCQSIRASLLAFLPNEVLSNSQSVIFQNHICQQETSAWLVATCHILLFVNNDLQQKGFLLHSSVDQAATSLPNEVDFSLSSKLQQEPLSSHQESLSSQQASFFQSTRPLLWTNSHFVRPKFVQVKIALVWFDFYSLWLVGLLLVWQALNLNFFYIFNW